MSGKTRHSIKVGALGLTSACASDILSVQDWRGDALGLVADKTRYNADQNDQTISTIRAVKNS